MIKELHKSFKKGGHVSILRAVSVVVAQGGKTLVNFILVDSSVWTPLYYEHLYITKRESIKQTIDTTFIVDLSVAAKPGLC